MWFPGAVLVCECCTSGGRLEHRVGLLLHVSIMKCWFDELFVNVSFPAVWARACTIWSENVNRSVEFLLFVDIVW